MGAILGFVSGIAPGPFTAVVAVTALEKGMAAAFRLAFIPLITEGPALLTAVFFLTNVPRGALQWIGFAGGVLIMYLGYRVFRGADRSESFSRKNPDLSKKHFMGIALAMLLSPSPWIFWMLLGAPLFLHQWHQGLVPACLFLIGFFGFLIGTQTLIARGASSGRNLASELRGRLIRAAGIGLIVGGVVLSWTSYEGDFSSLISPQRTVQKAVESEIG